MVHSSDSHVVEDAQKLVAYLRQKGDDAKSPMTDVNFETSNRQHVYENITGADYVLVICNKRFGECLRTDANGNFEF